MYYRHELDIKYPEKSDEHMITVKHLRDVNFDENYSFRDRTFFYKINRGLYFLLLNTIVFLVARIKHGLRIYGRNNLRKYKDILKNGAITISNHVMMWDFLCVLRAIRPHLVFFPAWPTNFEGPNRNFIKWVGGVPVPTESIRSMAAFSRAIDNILDDGKWLHCYPEGSMWYYYPDIRPFKKGVFKYAVRHNKPVVPIGLSFRPRKGLYKLFGKTPCVDMHIGEPIMPDISIPYPEGTEKLTKECYKVVQGLVGINPGDPTYNENLKIEEYKKTM